MIEWSKAGGAAWRVAGYRGRAWQGRGAPHALSWRRQRLLRGFHDALQRQQRALARPVALPLVPCPARQHGPPSCIGQLHLLRQRCMAGGELQTPCGGESRLEGQRTWAAGRRAGWGSATAAGAARRRGRAPCATAAARLQTFPSAPAPPAPAAAPGGCSTAPRSRPPSLQARRSHLHRRPTGLPSWPQGRCAGLTYSMGASGLFCLLRGTVTRLVASSTSLKKAWYHDQRKQPITAEHVGSPSGATSFGTVNTSESPVRPSSSFARTLLPLAWLGPLLAALAPAWSGTPWAAASSHSASSPLHDILSVQAAHVLLATRTPPVHQTVKQAMRKDKGAALPVVTAPAAVRQLCRAQDQLRSCVCLMHRPHAQGSCIRAQISLCTWDNFKYSRNSGPSWRCSWPELTHNGISAFCLSYRLTKSDTSLHCCLRGWMMAENVQALIRGTGAARLPVTSLDTPRQRSAAARWRCASATRPTSSAWQAASRPAQHRNSARWRCRRWGSSPISRPSSTCGSSSSPHISLWVGIPGCHQAVATWNHASLTQPTSSAWLTASRLAPQRSSMRWRCRRRGSSPVARPSDTCHSSFPPRKEVLPSIFGRHQAPPGGRHMSSMRLGRFPPHLGSAAALHLFRLQASKHLHSPQPCPSLLAEPRRGLRKAFWARQFPPAAHAPWYWPIGLQALLLTTCSVSCSTSAWSAAAGPLRMRCCTAATLSAHHFQGRLASGDRAREARRPPWLQGPSMPADAIPHVSLWALAIPELSRSHRFWCHPREQQAAQVMYGTKHGGRFPWQEGGIVRSLGANLVC